MNDDSRIEALEAQVAALTALIERQSVAPAHEPRAQPVEPPQASRRGMLKMAGAAAAAGIVGVTAISTQQAAAAHDPEDLGLGIVNTTSTAPTTANYVSATRAAAFLFQTGTDFNATDSSYPCALAGWATAAAQPHGVYGFTSQAGSGVVAGGGGPASVGLTVGGVKAALAVTPLGAAPRLRGDAHVVGEIIVDIGGDLSYCTVAGTPGTWRKLAGPATSGQLHVLASTVRVYDSRPGQAPATGGKAPLPGGGERVIDTKFGGAVPAGAVAALVNVTVVNTSASGFVALFKNGIPYPGNSTINWFLPNSIVANSAVVALDTNALFNIRSGGGATDLLIDVVGYYA